MTTSDHQSAPDPAATYQGRELTARRRWLYRIATPIGLLLVRFFWATCRIRLVLGEAQALEGLKDGPIIPVYWHQHQLFLGKYLIGLRRIGMDPGFLISPSVDGEIPSRIAQRHGCHVIRGSSSHTGARTLRDYYLALQKGVSPAITVDGPTGPAFECKPGAVMLAQLSGRPIVALSFHASRAWLFHKWDRFVLPKPFSTITIALGAPRYVPKRIDAPVTERLQKEIDAELKALYRQARESAV
ncbi:MAG: lysophospholipid acyltransferase family protein [Pseudomonadota bacterium]|jgi:hypothetical protein